MHNVNGTITVAVQQRGRLLEGQPDSIIFLLVIMYILTSRHWRSTACFCSRTRAVGTSHHSVDSHWLCLWSPESRLLPVSSCNQVDITPEQRQILQILQIFAIMQFRYLRMKCWPPLCRRIHHQLPTAPRGCRKRTWAGHCYAHPTQRQCCPAHGVVLPRSGRAAKYIVFTFNCKSNLKNNLSYLILRGNFKMLFTAILIT